MLNDQKVSLIGAGNMGSALLRGLIRSKTARPENLICTDIRKSQLNWLRAEFGVRTMTDNLAAVQEADIVIYAVKPQILAATLNDTVEALNMDKLVISIAAGVSLRALETRLEKALRVIKVMPNICTSVGMGAAAIAAGQHVKEGDIDLAKEIFNSVGTSIVVGENAQMDAVTGLSGSGPAYIFLIIDAMADAGVKMGLGRGEALALSTQTILGAAKMLLETGKHPGLLKDQVTSPGGTTIAGLHALEMGGLRSTMINAVEAATLRAKELGQTLDAHFMNAK